LTIDKVEAEAAGREEIPRGPLAFFMKKIWQVLNRLRKNLNAVVP
jgi:hypothetical protein